jgi:hypothetical protein
MINLQLVKKEKDMSKDYLDSYSITLSIDASAAGILIAIIFSAIINYLSNADMEIGILQYTVIFVMITIGTLAISSLLLYSNAMSLLSEGNINHTKKVANVARKALEASFLMFLIALFLIPMTMNLNFALIVLLTQVSLLLILFRYYRRIFNQ